VLHIGGPGLGTGRARRGPTATLLVVATVVCLGLGAYWGQPGWNGGVPFALQEVGAVLFPAGAILLGFAVRVVRRRRRERIRDRARPLR
jgi:NhaP-type Na+/H+ or K+/H+ antiporter